MHRSKSGVEVDDPIFPFLRRLLTVKPERSSARRTESSSSCILQTSCLPRSHINKIITARNNHVQLATFLGCGGRYGSPCRGHRKPDRSLRYSDVGSRSQVSSKPLVDVSLFNPIPKLCTGQRATRAWRERSGGSLFVAHLKPWVSRSQVF